MSSEKRRKKYQVFTPEATVKRMLDEIGYKGSEIIDKTIADISCGDGAFLKEALKRYISACKEMNIQDNKIFSMAVGHIFGYENDEHFYKQCQQNLSSILSQTINTDIKITFKNIHFVDGLMINDIHFDFVVGNPPYLSYKEMSKEQREYLQQNFESCKEQKFDYSYAFIEKSIKLLREDGMACIISPINMYKIKSGRLMRVFLRSKLFKIIDVTEDNIFPGVLTNPVISLYKAKTDSDVIDLVKFTKQTAISIDTFYGVEDDAERQTEKKRFGDYFSVHNGVATLLNSAFLVPDSLDIEKEVLKNACSPKETRYKINNKIIFPYKTKDGIVEKYSEEEFKTLFPKAYDYLLQNKKRLLQRDSDASAKWFEYGRSQAIASICSEKIMISAIMSEKMKPICLDENDVVYAGFFVVPKNPDICGLKEALPLLSSPNLYEYIRKVGVKMNGKSYRYSVKDLENYMF